MKERPLSEKEIQRYLGYDYTLDDVIKLLEDYRARGESVYIIFNGQKLSSDEPSKKLRDDYNDWAEAFRAAIKNPGRYIYEDHDDDR